MSQALAKQDDIEPIGRRVHNSEATIDTALVALAEAGGSEAASKQLAEIGKHIPARTIRQWRQDYPMRYAHLVARHRPKLDQIIAADIRDLARMKLDAQSDAVRLVHEALRNGTAKDPSQDLQRLSISTGIDITKLGELEGRPIVHEHHHKDVVESVDELVQRFPGLFIEGTAEEIHADQDQEDAGKEIPGQEDSEEASRKAQPRKEARDDASTGPDTRDPQG